MTFPVAGKHGMVVSGQDLALEMLKNSGNAAVDAAVTAAFIMSGSRMNSSPKKDSVPIP